MRTDKTRWNPPAKMFFIFANRLTNLVRKLGKMGEGDDNPQSSGKVLDWVGKQKLQGGVDENPQN